MSQDRLLTDSNQLRLAAAETTKPFATRGRVTEGNRFVWKTLPAKTSTRMGGDRSTQALSNSGRFNDEAHVQSSWTPAAGSRKS